jgi:hypothetical protein
MWRPHVQKKTKCIISMFATTIFGGCNVLHLETKKLSISLWPIFILKNMCHSHKTMVLVNPTWCFEMLGFLAPIHPLLKPQPTLRLRNFLFDEWDDM